MESTVYGGTTIQIRQEQYPPTVKRLACRVGRRAADLTAAIYNALGSIRKEFLRPKPRVLIMGQDVSARFVIAERIHEVCSFNPLPTRYGDFLVHRGERMFDYHRGIGSEVSGARGAFAEHPGIEIVPAFGARGIASVGTIPAADFARIAEEFLADLRAVGPVDAAYF